MHRQVLARNLTFAVSSNNAAGQLAVMTANNVPKAVIHRQQKLTFNLQLKMKKQSFKKPNISFYFFCLLSSGSSLRV